MINEEKSQWFDVWFLHDWYHSFNDLYEHRHLLLLNRLKVIREWWCATIHHDSVWWSDTNSDWSKWGWWIVVWISDYITYHLPVKYQNYVLWFKKLDKGKWDWHNSKDVLERLEKILLWEITLL